MRPSWRHKALNLALVVVDTLVVRLLLPVSLIEVALIVRQHHIGILNLVTWPSAAAVLISVLILDLIIYVQHLVFHHVPLLWRLHRVHHTDPVLDVTSGVRFHPLEIALSALIKVAAIAAFGVAPFAVLIFEVLLNVSSIFNHANWKLPERTDRLLRLLLVTPGMHRVHHSAVTGELNTNFGFNLSWWDRLFRTYRPRSATPAADMPIGLPGEVGVYRGFLELLWLPFRRT
ncbi:MAG: sterol desaturase family protein [Gammaproteobacteria bacterium]|nr:sterol desaturase family protein [Gammaproteobacteria bacterium]